jgi:DNA modification methylase
MAQATLSIVDSRWMGELPDESIAFIVTSPSYWHSKDYGASQQIGYGQSATRRNHRAVRFEQCGTLII